MMSPRTLCPTMICTLIVSDRRIGLWFGRERKVVS